MKRKEIIILTDFSGLDAYFVANKDLIRSLSKEFNSISFVNCVNLKSYNRLEQYQKKIKSKFPKKIKFFNPKNFKDFNNFLFKKKPLIINNIGRGFEFYRLLYFLKKKNIPQVLLGNVGNIQASTYYWHLPNLKIIIFLFTILLPRWISTILVFLGIFDPIEIRFVSNKKQYDYYLKQKNRNKLLKLPRYYKKLVLVKGKIFDNYEKYKDKLEEKFILLLEMQPEYRSMTEVSELKKSSINVHYKNLNNLLHKLSKTFKKKVIISIHPEYDLKIAEKRYPNFKIIIFLFTILLPRWISTILVFLGIFDPIEIRFVSNKKQYDYYLKQKNRNKLLKLPRYYKKLVLVKGKIFDNYEKYKDKLEEKFILLLEMQPEYRSMTEVSELKKSSINVHYKNLNNLLHKLSKTFKKKVIISIHPEYDLKIAEKRYPNFKVAKLKTKDYILKSFLILFFDSSAILPAFVMNKKVLTLRSQLFKGIRYNSDLYSDYINLKSVNINNNIDINKKQFIQDLDKRVKSYSNYLKTYSASHLSEPGNKFIIKYLKKKYF